MMRPSERQALKADGDGADVVGVLYSGGTDSTLAAYRAGERFRRVHLITYRRFGMFNLEHSETNITKLRDALGQDKFVRPSLIRFDRLFKHVSYESYARDVLRHGFMVLTTCGLCKLAMHLRTIVYCADHGVGNVWDGANKNMTIFPAQMSEVLQMLRGMYGLAGIRYDSPVYDYDDDQGINFGNFLYGLSPARTSGSVENGAAQETTGAELFRLGVLPRPDVKGTATDKQMQGRCYQFVLFNLWARWYYLERNSMDSYRSAAIAFYADKIRRCEQLVREFVDSPDSSRLRELVEDRQ